MNDFGTNVHTKTFRDEFVKRLTNLVDKRKYELDIKSDKAFCERIGLNYETYKRWKEIYKTDAGVKEYARYPKYNHLIFLANEFNVSIDYLTLRTDEKSPKHTEIDFNIKNISELTGLNKNVVTALCSTEFHNGTMRDFINFFFDEKKEVVKLLKQYMVCEDESEKRKLNIKISLACDEDREKNNIYHWKRCFINYISSYVFFKIKKVTAHNFNDVTDAGEDLKSVDLQAFSLIDETGNNLDIQTITTEDLKRFYLNVANDFINKIKDYYLKNNMQKEKDFFITKRDE